MRFEVYLPAQAAGEQEAQTIINGARQIAGLDVAVMQVGSESLQDFFAGVAPIYLLDDELLASGHPPPDALLSHLRQRVSSPSVQPAQAHPVAASLLFVDVFRDLSQQDLAVLSARMWPRSYMRGQIIYRQGAEAVELFLLRQGRVELYHLTRQGKRFKLGHIRPGMFFGEAAMLGRTIYVSTAEAAEPVQVSALGRAAFDQLLREQPTIAGYLVMALSRRLLLSELRLVGFAYHDAPTRVASELMSLKQEEQATLLPITHQELGERCGLLRETVTKTLDTFQERGLVELHRGRIVLRDVEGLQALLEESPREEQPYE
ncbi:MAG TPA: Crp/Fnr family transcriptional regulator [Ktedonobacterales bacterium]|jgi:CRP-like cAMP-binding protein